MFFVIKRHRSAAVCRAGTVLLGLALNACATPPKPVEPLKAAPKPAPTATAEVLLAPEPPMPRLEQVALRASEVPGVLEFTQTGRALDGAFEILQFSGPRDFAAADWQHNEVHLDGAAQPYAFLSQDLDLQRHPELRLWLRRPLADAGRELNGDCYTPAEPPRAGMHYRFRAPISQQKPDPKLSAAWLEALRRDLSHRQGPFYSYANAKLGERQSKAKGSVQLGNSADGSEFARLIGTTTGRSSIQEALLQNRGLYLDLTSGARKVPIGKLVAPRLTRHPWPAMLAQLQQKPGLEPLARATPADFYFVRVQDFSTFLDLSSLAESWGAPALDLLDGKVQDRGLRARYQTELALEDSELSRTFGPSVIEELALVGSDPYLVEGSDLTLIFRVKSGLLFDAALLKALSNFSALHTGIATQQSEYEGVQVSLARSSDGQVRQQRASVAGYELVSNSAAAIRRVISTIHGKALSLADEPDFAYMLARDADQSAPVLAFAGDRFVQSVIGPEQKIKAAERQLASAELSRPGYAALLYGFLNGHSPLAASDLVASKLLATADLKPGGVAAGWQPGSIAQSSRGSTRGMLPLIDAPAVTFVTAAEQAGYESFARSYESEWSDYVDPFAVRVSRTAAANGGVSLAAQLRVLPLLRREYREFTQTVGQARVQPGALPDGFRMLLGIGKDAKLRQLLTQASHSFTEHSFSFDWLGDYAFAGVADRSEAAEAARWFRDTAPQPFDYRYDEGRKQHERAFAQTPAYAGIAIRSAAGATLALALLKKVGDEVAPGTLIWSEARKHRGSSVMSVRSAEKDEELADFTLYYALAPHALLFSLNEAVLESVLDLYADGKAPAAVDGKGGAGDAQLVVDLKGKQQGALFSVLSWVLNKNLVAGCDRAQDSANALFRGAPELIGDPEKAAELMRNYFGSVVQTPEGKAYGFGADGVQDPLRGSASSPKWPVIPVPGSPVAQVTERLESLRSEISFDDEPSGGQSNAPLQSLRVRLTLSLR